MYEKKGKIYVHIDERNKFLGVDTELNQEDKALHPFVGHPKANIQLWSGLGGTTSKGKHKSLT